MNETMKIIESLKTVRRFSNEEISEENLKIILKACVNAASASCRQTYSIIVVNDKEVMKKIGYVGSVMLVFCVDYNRVIDTAHFLGYEYGSEVPIVDFITGSTDTILAAQTAAIAAKSLGIDSFFTNCVHRGNIERIYKLLNLPKEHCFPSIALILGYSGKQNCKSSNKGRLSGNGVIHYNEYKKLNDEDLQNIVNEYDNKDKHYLSLINDWREKGYKHYLDYFYEEWCKCSKTGNENEKIINNQYAHVQEMMIKTGFLDVDK